MPGVELATAYVSIVTDGSKIVPEVKKQFGQVERDADRSGKSAGKRFSGGFSGALKPAVAAVGGLFALDKIKDFVGGAISEASDLGESVNALNVTYGKSSKAIQRLSEDAASGLGLAKTEFNSLAVQFAGFANVVGGRPAKFIDDLTTRAADFASVMNLDVAEAAQLFQSGLAGETEPLRRFGLDLSAAAVEAHAYRRGIAAAGEELTEQQKVQARYSLLMAKTAKTAGDFTNTSDSLANSQRILGAEWQNLQAVAGEKLVPVLAELTSEAADFVTGMQDGTGAGGKFVDIAQEIGGTFKSDVLPVLEDVVDVGQDVIGFFSDLPGPVKSLGLQAAGAAFILPRLTSAVTASTTAVGLNIARLKQWRAEMTYAETRSAALGGKVKSLAGVGGMLALTDSFTRAHDKGVTLGGTLEGAVGGAMTGLAVGGPIGALVGAVGGGGLSALIGAFSDTRSESQKLREELIRSKGFDQAKANAESLREALVGIANEYGKVGRAAVEAGFRDNKDGELDGWVKDLRDAGVSMDTIVSATMGNAKAQGIVSAAFAKSARDIEAEGQSVRDYYQDIKDGRADLVTATGQVIPNGMIIPKEEIERAKEDWLDYENRLDAVAESERAFRANLSGTTGAIKDHRRDVRDLATDLGLTVREYNKLEKPVRLRIEEGGLPQTSQDAMRLIGHYRSLQNIKGIKTVVSAPGVDLTFADIGKLQRRYDLTPDQVTTLVKQEGLEVTERSLRNFIQKYGKKSIGTATMLAKISGLNVSEQQLRNWINNAKTTASQGGREVGSALGSGMWSGMDSWAQSIRDKAASLAASAAKAAKSKKGADSNSPSRKTLVVGRSLAEGLAVGMDQSRPTVTARGAALAQAAVNGVVQRGKKDQVRARGFARGLTKALTADLANSDKEIKDRLARATARIDKQLRDKDITKARAREMSKVVAEASKGLTKLEKRYDQHLDTLKQMRESRSSLISEVASVFTGELDLSAAVREDEFGFGGQATFASVAAVVSGLRSRISQTITLMKQALGAGIPKGLVREILGMGTTQAIPVLKALLSGSKAQRASLAQDYNAIFGTAKAMGLARQAGVVLGDAFYASGIAAQEGLLNGLLDDKAIDKAAKKLSNKLTKAVKKALGIKSPSRKMHDEVGLDSGRGIGEGALDGLAPYPSRIADVLAATEARRVRVATPVLTPDAATSGAVMTAPDLLDRLTINVTLVPTGRQKAQLFIDGQIAAERYL
jgi:hypothetical protein